MSRTPSIAEALAGAVLFGDIKPDQARDVLLCGLPDDLPAYRSDDPKALRDARQAVADGRPALLHLTGAPKPWGAVGNAGCSIARKIGAFWLPQPLDARRALAGALRHTKGDVGALRSGDGVRSNANVAGLCCIAFEVDCGSKREQAALIDWFEQAHGVRIPLVVDSGDTRPASLARARLRHGVEVEPGKSLHMLIPIDYCSVGDPKVARIMAALCALFRADLAATDPARLLRLPGVVAGRWGAKRPRSYVAGDVVRVQTLLRADTDAAPFDLDELLAAVEAACDDLGLDIAECLRAMRVAAELRIAARALPPDQAAQCLELATLAEGLGKIPDDRDAEAAAWSKVAGARGSARAAAASEAVTLGGRRYRVGELQRDVPVRAVWNGETCERSLAAWAVLLSSRDKSAEGGGTPRGIRAWAPTPAGLRHTTGDKAGTLRAAPSATLWCDAGAVRLACHVEGVVYVPSLPRDKGAELQPFPAVAAQPWLQLPDELPPVVVLPSDTGTGKTRALAGGLRARALIAAPRVCIAAEAARRYGAVDYRNKGAAEGLCNGGRVAVCINSIGKIDLPDDGEPFDLVLEESEQIAAALFGGTIPLLPKGERDHAAAVVGALAAAARVALASGGRVIAADAFAGDLTEELLRAILPHDAPKPVAFGVARRREIPVRFYFDRTDDSAEGIDAPTTRARDAMHLALFDAVADGARAVVAVLSSRDAQSLADKCASLRKRNGDPVRVRFYAGDDLPHLGQAWRRPLDELADVNRAWGPEVCDVVIYTPVASAALSYDRDDLGSAFDVAALDAPRLPHTDWSLCLQMLDRVRRPAAVWIYAPERREGAPDVADLAIYRQRQAAEWAAEVADHAAAFGYDVETSDAADKPLAGLAAVCRYVADLRRADVAGELLRYFNQRGAEVEIVGDAFDAERADALRKAIRDGRKAYRDAWGEMVCDAEPLRDPDELDQLRDDLRAGIEIGKARDQAAAAVEAHTLRDRYGSDLLTPELVAADRNGEVWRGTREIVRAGLIADGMTHAATGRARAIVEAGCSAGAKGDTRRTVATLLLLRAALGSRWLADALAPLRNAGRGGDLPEQGSALLLDPLPDDGDGGLAGLQWSADTLDGATLAREYADQLARHGVDLRLLDGSGLHPGALARDPVRAVGKALRRLGLRTSSRQVSTVDGARARAYRLDVRSWARSLELARRRNARKRGLTVPSVFDNAPYSRADRAAHNLLPDPPPPIKTSVVCSGWGAIPPPLPPPPSWTAAAVEAACTGTADVLHCAVAVLLEPERAELWRIAESLPAPAAERLREVLQC
jgi:hypothetical protein